MLPRLQVTGITLIAVCLPLKRDAAVCPVLTSTDEEAYYPLYDIDKVETNEQQFLLLSRMYFLVMQPNIVQILLGKDHAEEVDGNI